MFSKKRYEETNCEMSRNMDFVNNFCSTTRNNNIVFCLCDLYNVNNYQLLKMTP
jgi:hypothetical protein